MNETVDLQQHFGFLTQWAPMDFVEMFCKSHKGIQPASEITRIEFKYVESACQDN